MSTKAIFCIVAVDAPPDVVWHDMYISPYRVKGYDTISFYDSYDDFEHWTRIGFEELFFRDAHTLEEMELFRLSNIIPDNAAELMAQWIDDYHTDKPVTRDRSYSFWTFVDYTRETLPKDAQQDTPNYRADVLEFIRASVGKRLVVQVD